MLRVPGSYVPAGETYPFWHYPDQFHAVKLMAEPARASQVIAANVRLADFISPWDTLCSVPLFSFLPPLLAAGAEGSLLVEAVMTGGRTFMLAPQETRRLGMPPRVYLDLPRLGWGDGLLEARLEIKGAGTLLERANLNRTALRRVLKGCRALRDAYNLKCAPSRSAALVSTRADFMKRNLGGQSERYSRHAVAASQNLLGRSRIKFVPTWIAMAQSATAQENMNRVSQSLPVSEALHVGRWTCELRFTPSTVRALYFTATRSDELLARLCSRVSRDPAELELTLGEMIADVRRHLEVLACTTQPSASVGFDWIKVGDINELFRPNANGQFYDAEAYRQKKYAWFLAKDDVIVRRYGKFFADMESYFGRDVGFHSDSEELLWFHHELLILAVLRDHIQVCSSFAVACELMWGRYLAPQKRRSLGGAMMVRVAKDVNRSNCVALHVGRRNVVVEMVYERLNKICKRFVIPRYQLAELYT